MQEYTFRATVQDNGKRLDLFIMDFAKANNLGLSRSNIQKIILDGNVKLNNDSSVKPHHKIKPNDEVILNIGDRKQGVLEEEDIPLDIIYEDDDVAVINKQPGLVVHPAPGNYAHTLVNALLHRVKKLSDVNPQRPGIVHRLDKDASGIMVVAKHNAAHLNLARQFSEHTVKRRYIALVKGRVEFDEDVIEMFIGRHPYKRKNMSVGFGKNLRYAKTYYRTLKRTSGFSLLELEPFTGRTHQLRVHLAFIGHPILGDTKYGKNNEFKRLALHSKYIEFTHPGSGKRMSFSSNIPIEFTDFIDKIQKENSKK